MDVLLKAISQQEPLITPSRYEQVKHLITSILAVLLDQIVGDGLS